MHLGQTEMRLQRSTFLQDCMKTPSSEGCCSGSLAETERPKSQASLTHSEWEPRQIFLDLVTGDNKVSYVNTLVWVGHVFFRTSGIVASDFQLLFKLLKFLEDYAGLPTKVTLDARIELNLRARSKSEEAAWAEHRRTLYELEKNRFFLTRRPILEVQGVGPEDQADVLEAEWAEFNDVRRRHASLHGLGAEDNQEGPRCPPESLRLRRTTPTPLLKVWLRVKGGTG